MINEAECDGVCKFELCKCNMQQTAYKIRPGFVKYRVFHKKGCRDKVHLIHTNYTCLENDRDVSAFSG